MSGWYEHFHLSVDPFDEDTPTWNLYYGGRYGVASLKLEQALERKRGLILVTGPPASGKSSLVRSALGRMRVFASATVSAAQTNPSNVIDVLLRSREPLENGVSGTRKRAALIAMIAQAHKSGRPIVCVVEDAHLARPGQIKDLVAAVDTAPDAADVFQIVLVGRPPLLDAMRARALGDLRARTSAIVETTALSPAEIAEFLTERLEASEAAMPDLFLPPVTMAAVAHHSRGIIGLAAAIARAALERAAESGSDTVSVELVEEVASLYGGAPQEAADARHRHPAARAFALGAAAALVLLALVVAAAEVRMLGTGGRRIRANVDALSSLAGFGQLDDAAQAASLGDSDWDEATATSDGGQSRSTGTRRDRQSLATSSKDEADALRLAQLGTPREEFLGDRSKPHDASKPYEVQIKPPPRPGSGASNAFGTEFPEEPAVITVPGVPGPLTPESSAARRDVIRSEDLAPIDPTPGSIETETIIRGPAHPSPMMPPATDTATARNIDPLELEMGGPRISLQVGAFRDRLSADALKEKLSREFSDVFVSTVHSGGEPLFRVRVGRFRSPEETLALKDRLQAAGYASFRVNDE